MKKHVLSILFLACTITLLGQSTSKRVRTGPFISTGTIFAEKVVGETFTNANAEEDELYRFRPSFGLGWWVEYTPGWANNHLALHLGVSYNWWNKMRTRGNDQLDITSSFWQTNEISQLQNIQLPLSIRHYWYSAGGQMRWYTGMGWQTDWVISQQQRTDVVFYNNSSAEPTNYLYEHTATPSGNNFTRSWENNLLFSMGFARQKVHVGATLQYTTSKTIEYDVYQDDPGTPIRPVVWYQTPLFERSPWRLTLEMGYSF